ncbi:MAG: CHAP domain-containing protein, partial [Alphaproteobacteria bacterium]
MTGGASANFREASYKASDGDIYRGWVLEDVFKLADPPSRPEVDRAAFIDICFFAAETFSDGSDSAPLQVVPEYLVARALIETGLKNSGPLLFESDAVGPLQVSSAEWTRFLKDGAPHSRVFSEGQYDDDLQQIWGAAWALLSDARKISRLKEEEGTGTKADPYIPSFLDVFHAHLTGSPAAAVSILNAQLNDADKSKPIGEILLRSMPPQEIASFYQRRSRFAGTQDDPRTLAGFVKETGVSLDTALEQAFQIIKDTAPELLPDTDWGDAPWHDVAETQIGIKEPDPRILEYFKSTDLHPLPDSTGTPWCGAFVAHCLANCGDADIASSIPKGAAVAAHWKNWGHRLPIRSNEIPVGAVVVLSPSPGSQSSGHVGFFEKFDGSRVSLLGGNQGHAVCKKSFLRSRIVSIGWQCRKPQPVAVPASSSMPGISDEAFDLIVEFEVTNQQVYEGKYRKAVWPGHSSGVTIGIGYDVGHVSKSQFID